MTTAEYINQSKSEAATQAKRLFLLRKACPGDAYVDNLLRQTVKRVEQEKTWAEIDQGWSSLEE